MAEAIDFDPRPRDAKQEHYRQLDRASERHAEALMDLYTIAQLLRDKGILELVKDTLGAGEQVMEVLTETLERDEVVRTIRNLTIFIKIIGSIEPDTLEKIEKALSRGAERSKARKPPGLLRLLGQLARPESRRAFEPAIAAVQAVGRGLPEVSKSKRNKTTRHKA